MDKISELQDRCNTKLESIFKQQQAIIKTISPPLIEAAHYSIACGGKRIRPLLVYAASQAANGKIELADHIAAVIEIIHTYSLIHDDLPAMDDDELRRGKPSCHIQYGEAIAILAGDYLQALAFTHLSQTLAEYNSNKAQKIIEIICKASISMVAGQALDITSINTIIDETTLKTMHLNKTGALISACIESGAWLSEQQLDQQQLTLFNQLGENIGYAFQIQDDLLDLDNDSDTIGKPQGSDVEKNKPTYPSILGYQKSKQLVAELHQEALELIDQLLGDTKLLKQICQLLSQRTY